MVKAMGVEHEHSRSRQGWGWRHVLLLAVFLAISAALLLPWGVSAFYLERAGHRMDAGRIPDAVEDRVAEEELQRALTWRPHNAQAYRLLARLYGQRGDLGAQADALATFVKLRPRDPLGHWELAVVCEKLPESELVGIPGQPCGSDGEGRRARLVGLWWAAGQSLGSFLQAGDRFVQEGDWIHALEFYRRALVIEPSAAAAWFGQAEAYQAGGDVEKALAAYARVTNLDADRDLLAAAYDRRGQLLADGQYWDDASLELSRAVALEPQQGQYRLHYGLYLYKAGAPSPQAREELKTAAHLLPRSPWPYVYLAHLDFSEQDYAGMLENAQRAVEIRPELFSGWFLRGRALHQLGRLGDAEQTLRHAIDLEASRDEVHAELGQVLAEQGRLEEAIEEYEQAVALSPESRGYYLNLGYLLQAVDQTDRAMEAFHRVLQLDPDNTMAKQALQELQP